MERRLDQAVAVKSILLRESEGAEIAAANTRHGKYKGWRESREREKFYFNEIRRLMREAREAGLFTVK